MKKALSLLLILVSVLTGNAQEKEIDSIQNYINQIEKSLKYETGQIKLAKGNASITVPKGFKYLDQEQSIYVLTDLWGNPKDEETLGMLLPENQGVLGSDSWAFIISYDDMGFVKDDDAEDFDYKELEEQLREETKEANPERIAQGYDPIEFIGWAAAPYYDKDHKVLHWAKEIKFGTEEGENTLNYNLRILGRKGIFMFNAVAGKSQLEEVKSKINGVISSVKFDEGFAYSDFNPDIDNVAKWTIGGLVAGKILAKVGFFALFAKFWKLILLGVAGIGSFFRKKKKNNDV